MFRSLFFLIVALLVIALAPTGNNDVWVESPLEAFLLGIVIYGATLLAIYFVRKSLFAHLALILFLVLFHFVLAAQRFYGELPLFIDSQGISALISLILYLGGLGYYHSIAFHQEHPTTKAAFANPCSYALTQLRLLLPFTIPFLLLSFFFDLLKLTGSATVVVLIGTGLLMVAMLLFLPPLIQKLWKCEPLPESELKQRLEALCTKAQFKHGGLKTWTVMNHSLTAGVIGIIAPFRYVMFTRRLLQELPTPAIEAILAHEIGHNYRKHLLIYPFIIFGMMLCVGLFSLFFSQAITEHLALQNLRYPSPLWTFLNPIALLIPYILIIAFYFRGVFGHFSRLFERQADQHIFFLGLPAHSMIDALDQLARLSGNSHKMPCWHHHSIQERIDYLETVNTNRNLIHKHDKKVRRHLLIYAAIAGLGLRYLLAPLFPTTYPFKTMQSATQEVSGDIDNLFNNRLRKNVAENLLVEGNRDTLLPILEKSLTKAGAVYIPGLAEYYATLSCIEKQLLPEAVAFMKAVWIRFDYEVATPELINEFTLTTNFLLDKSPDEELQALRRQHGTQPR